MNKICHIICMLYLFMQRLKFDYTSHPHTFTPPHPPNSNRIPAPSFNTPQCLCPWFNHLRYGFNLNNIKNSAPSSHRTWCNNYFKDQINSALLLFIVRLVSNILIDCIEKKQSFLILKYTVNTRTVTTVL
jgi:hypothetical protein